MGHGNGKRLAYQASGQSSNLKGKKRDLKYFYYKKISYIKSECKKMKTDLTANNNSYYKKEPELQKENAKLASAQKKTLIKLFMAYEERKEFAEIWIIDLRVTSTMTSRKEWFCNYIPFKLAIPIGLGDDRIINAIGSGPVRISMEVDGRSMVYELCNIYYVSNIGMNNLLSVMYISERNYSSFFG